MYVVYSMDPTTQYITTAIITALLIISEYLGTSAQTKNKSVYNLVTNILMNALNSLQQGSTGAIVPTPISAAESADAISITQVNSHQESSTSHTRDTPGGELQKPVWLASATGQELTDNK
jgi:hypothetical protein